ncbi:MAG: class I SAM-dependent methyltransferase [Deltaproteobacteria bacterium]|nr:class I SAM-dependent methyltransferase [Deltaproteobacteria bacterium]
MNAEIDGHPGKYTVVDPYPADCIRKGSLNLQQVMETRVEVLDPSFFDQLNENDILFIDSGHCVRIGGDVNYLFLEIFPRLAPGVIVHIHDISLPYEYPKTYATSETFRQFWTEQYLLQSFLCFNNEFEIMLAMNFLMKDYSDVFTQAFPLYNPDIHPFTSGSFWIQRKLLV